MGRRRFCAPWRQTSLLCTIEADVFVLAFLAAFPNALFTAGIKYWVHSNKSEDLNISFLVDNAPWGAFSFLVGFLIIFRTSQAYARFWEGATAMHAMRAEWFDACSSLISFCKYSEAPTVAIQTFEQTIIRLFSLLHAVALADIEDTCTQRVEDVRAFRMHLVDPQGIDEESLCTLRDSDAKVELLFQWIQQLIVENVRSGVLSIPPPLLTRAFHEMANGMLRFQDAVKIAVVPFPFSYAQTCDLLLAIHWFVIPLVVSQWVTRMWWAALFSFIQVFILVALQRIAVEIENPFGMKANDLDAEATLMVNNRHLSLLVEESTKRTPRLSKEVGLNSTSTTSDWSAVLSKGVRKRISLAETWEIVDTSVRMRASQCESTRQDACASNARISGSSWTPMQRARISSSSRTSTKRTSLGSSSSAPAITSSDSCSAITRSARASIKITGRLPLGPQPTAIGSVGIARNAAVNADGDERKKKIDEVIPESCSWAFLGIDVDEKCSAKGSDDERRDQNSDMSVGSLPDEAMPQVGQRLKISC